MIQKGITLLEPFRGHIAYLMAGGFSFAVDAGSFWILQHIQSSLFVATLVSFCLGLTSSFLLNRYFVFRSKGENKHHSNKRQVAMFIALTIFNFGFSYLVVRLAKQYLGIAVLGKVIAMGFIVVWNFTIFQRVIFRVEHIDADM